MKQRFERIRKWLIVKLGGYVEPPLPVVRFDRIDVPIHKICAEGIYPMNCDQMEIKRIMARKLGDQICDAGLVKYEYRYDERLAPSCERVVRARIRVVETSEDVIL